ncbi:MAG: histone H1 [Acidobacteria bacterium]|nr:MAG: histone H1 [Acidobacteriota bacterium]
MAKRPRDPNQLAKLVVDIATGKVPDPVSEQKRKPSGLKGRSGGLKTQEQRKRIAAKAAQARWHSRKDE